MGHMTHARRTEHDDVDVNKICTKFNEALKRLAADTKYGTSVTSMYRIPHNWTQIPTQRSVLETIHTSSFPKEALPLAAVSGTRESLCATPRDLERHVQRWLKGESHETHDAVALEDQLHSSVRSSDREPERGTQNTQRRSCMTCWSAVATLFCEDCVRYSCTPCMVETHHNALHTAHRVMSSTIAHDALTHDVLSHGVETLFPEPLCNETLWKEPLRKGVCLHSFPSTHERNHQLPPRELMGFRPLLSIPDDTMGVPHCIKRAVDRFTPSGCCRHENQPLTWACKTCNFLLLCDMCREDAVACSDSTHVNHSIMTLEASSQWISSHLQQLISKAQTNLKTSRSSIQTLSLIRSTLPRLKKSSHRDISTVYQELFTGTTKKYTHLHSCLCEFQKNVVKQIKHLDLDAQQFRAYLETKKLAAVQALVKLGDQHASRGLRTYIKLSPSFEPLKNTPSPSTCLVDFPPLRHVPWTSLTPVTIAQTLKSMHETLHAECSEVLVECLAFKQSITRTAEDLKSEWNQHDVQSLLASYNGGASKPLSSLLSRSEHTTPCFVNAAPTFQGTMLCKTPFSDWTPMVVQLVDAHVLLEPCVVSPSTEPSFKQDGLPTLKKCIICLHDDALTLKRFTDPISLLTQQQVKRARTTLGLNVQDGLEFIAYREGSLLPTTQLSYAQQRSDTKTLSKYWLLGTDDSTMIDNFLVHVKSRIKFIPTDVQLTPSSSSPCGTERTESIESTDLRNTPFLYDTDPHSDRSDAPTRLPPVNNQQAPNNKEIDSTPLPRSAPYGASQLQKLPCSTPSKKEPFSEDPTPATLVKTAQQRYAYGAVKKKVVPVQRHRDHFPGSGPPRVHTIVRHDLDMSSPLSMDGSPEALDQQDIPAPPAEKKHHGGEVASGSSVNPFVPFSPTQSGTLLSPVTAPLTPSIHSDNSSEVRFVHHNKTVQEENKKGPITHRSLSTATRPIPADPGNQEVHKNSTKQSAQRPHASVGGENKNTQVKEPPQEMRTNTKALLPVHDATTKASVTPKNIHANREKSLTIIPPLTILLNNVSLDTFREQQRYNAVQDKANINSSESFTRHQVPTARVDPDVIPPESSPTAGSEHENEDHMTSSLKSQTDECLAPPLVPPDRDSDHEEGQHSNTNAPFNRPPHTQQTPFPPNASFSNETLPVQDATSTPHSQNVTSISQPETSTAGHPPRDVTAQHKEIPVLFQRGFLQTPLAPCQPAQASSNANDNSGSCSDDITREGSLSTDIIENTNTPHTVKLPQQLHSTTIPRVSTISLSGRIQNAFFPYSQSPSTAPLTCSSINSSVISVTSSEATRSKSSLNQYPNHLLQNVTSQPITEEDSERHSFSEDQMSYHGGSLHTLQCTSSRGAAVSENQSRPLKSRSHSRTHINTHTSVKKVPKYLRSYQREREASSFFDPLPLSFSRWDFRENLTLDIYKTQNHYIVEHMAYLPCINDVNDMNSDLNQLSWKSKVFQRPTKATALRSNQTKRTHKRQETVNARLTEKNRAERNHHPRLSSANLSFSSFKNDNVLHKSKAFMKKIFFPNHSKESGCGSQPLRKKVLEKRRKEKTTHNTTRTTARKHSTEHIRQADEGNCAENTKKKTPKHMASKIVCKGPTEKTKRETGLAPSTTAIKRCDDVFCSATKESTYDYCDMHATLDYSSSKVDAAPRRSVQHPFLSSFQSIANIKLYNTPTVCVLNQ